MTACTLTSFDLGQCAHDTLLGWLDPYWPYLVWGFWGVVALIVLGALYRVKMVFGTPGLVAVWSGAVLIAGFVLGRRSLVRAEPNAAGQPTVKFPGHQVPVVVQKPQHVTIFNGGLKGLGGN